MKALTPSYLLLFIYHHAPPEGWCVNNVLEFHQHGPLKSHALSRSTIYLLLKRFQAHHWLHFVSERQPNRCGPPEELYVLSDKGRRQFKTMTTSLRNALALLEAKN